MPASYRISAVSLPGALVPALNDDGVPHLNSTLPSLDGVALWRNGPAPAYAHLSDHPVLVHFFSTGCPLCREGMSAVSGWRAQFAPRGLIVIGAYHPRRDSASNLADAEFECDRHVRPAHACALDIDGVLAARFGNEWAPAYYVYDRGHRLRHFQMGNWNLAAVGAIIEACI